MTGSGEPEVSNLPEFEFIATIQIDQWERFPPKKNYRLIQRTNRKSPLFLSDEFGKTEPMKTFDSSYQLEKNFIYMCLFVCFRK